MYKRQKQHGSGEAARQKWAEKVGPFRSEIAYVIKEAMERTQPRSILAAVRAWGEALIERITRSFGPRPEPLMVGKAGQRTGANLASAYSTAAGVRHLAERSASFERMDVLKAALGFAEKGATVREIERRVDTLVEQGVLITGRAGTEHADRLTTRDLLGTEQSIIRAAREGAGSVAALLDRATATVTIVELEQQRGFALSDEQKDAVLALVSGNNAIQIVQGDAGTGKTTLFAFVNEVAGSVGRAPLFLTTQASLVAEMRENGLDAHTLASVLVAHADRAGRTSPSEGGRALLQDRLVIVEEASMVSTREAALLIELADKACALKLAFVGDEKQIDPVRAGRAFSLMQQHGVPTATLTENRRQLDSALREAVEHARKGDLGRTFDALGQRIVERADPAATAADLFLSLSSHERDRTALLTSGHVLREAVLDHVREGLQARGELGSQALSIEMLDRLNLTREELRSIRSWAEGMRLEVYRGQAGLNRGSYKVGIVSPEDNLVQLTSGGEEHWLDPRGLHPSGSGASLAVPGRMEVREGDRLIFTSPDKDLGVVNGTRASVTAIEGETLHLANGERQFALGPDDPAREHLGHAVVLNMHRAQGITVDRAIAVMSSGDRLLNSESLHYVLQTRAREELTLVTDDRDALRDSIEGHRGSVPHAMDLAPELRDAGGEAFDPKTGELLENPVRDAPSPTDLFEKAMATEFPAPEKEPVRPREKEVEREEPDIGDDFEMEM